jgi:hypothetical protein
VSAHGAHSDSGSQAQVTARFQLQAAPGEDAAAGAAELIRRLQEIGSLPHCACDLDVSVRWPGAASNGSTTASTR